VTHGLDGRAGLRLQEVGQHLRTAAEAIASARPDAAEGVQAGLAALHERFQQVHEFCDDVDERTWAAYTTGLDRGLADLAADLSVEGGDTSAADLVYAHTARLEVDGWVLRLDVAGRDAPVEGRELVAGAAHEVEDYQAAVRAGEAPSRAGVERALNELRGSAG
jgi:hypothetical protein